MRGTVLILSLALLLTFSGAAQAQEHQSVDSTMQAIELKHDVLFNDPILKPSLEEIPEGAKRRSKAIAFMASFLGTAGPTAAAVPMLFQEHAHTPIMGISLLSSGLIIGPSAGYFYAGQTHRAMKGFAIRTGVALTGCLVGSVAVSGGGLEAIPRGITVAAITSGVILIYGIYDIAAVAQSVERRNQIIRDRANIRLSPTYFADSGAAGMQLQVTF
jgi:hypothetical protein